MATLNTGMTARQRSTDVSDGRLTGRGIDQHDVRGQRHGHANEPVLHQVGKVARLFSVLTEVVGVDRPEERIVRIPVARPLRQQRFETGAGGRRGQLEGLRRHVAVRARASVSPEVLEFAVVEGLATMRDHVAWLITAVELHRAAVLRDDRTRVRREQNGPDETRSSDGTGEPMARPHDTSPSSHVGIPRARGNARMPAK